jgi:hypothetical protein
MGQVKPVDGIQEESGSDAFVEILAAAAEGIEFGAVRQQFVHISGATNGIE